MSAAMLFDMLELVIKRRLKSLFDIQKLVTLEPVHNILGQGVSSHEPLPTNPHPCGIKEFVSALTGG
jgi:hypothetical protein